MTEMGWEEGDIFHKKLAHCVIFDGGIKYSTHYKNQGFNVKDLMWETPCLWFLEFGFFSGQNPCCMFRIFFFVDVPFPIKSAS